MLQCFRSKFKSGCSFSNTQVSNSGAWHWLIDVTAFGFLVTRNVKETEVRSLGLNGDTEFSVNIKNLQHTDMLFMYCSLRCGASGSATGEKYEGILSLKTLHLKVNASCTYMVLKKEGPNNNSGRLFL